MISVSIKWIVVVSALGFGIAGAQTPPQQTAVVIANAPIFGVAEFSPTPLRVAAPGTVLRVLKRESDWVQLEFLDPVFGLRAGWVQQSFLNITDNLQPMDLSVSPAPVATSRSRAPLAPCLIVKIYQKKAADAWTRMTTPKPYNYIEGDFPSGFEFRNELNDKHIREIQGNGGHVVVMKPDYALPDLEDARRSCRTWQESRQ
jgi:hypothetical protein